MLLTSEDVVVEGVGGLLLAMFEAELLGQSWLLVSEVSDSAFALDQGNEGSSTISENSDIEGLGGSLIVGPDTTVIVEGGSNLNLLSNVTSSLLEASSDVVDSVRSISVVKNLGTSGTGAQLVSFLVDPLVDSLVVTGVVGLSLWAVSNLLFALS